MLVRCARDAISGTTPPKTRWTSCDRITSERWTTSSPLPSRTAAEVSSHEVSIPRIRVNLVCLFRQQPFDQPAILRRIPVAGADQLFSDYPIATDDHGLRVTSGLIQLAHFAF